jgi:hypothetical protein
MTPARPAAPSRWPIYQMNLVLELIAGVSVSYIRFDGPDEELIVRLPCSADGLCDRAELQRITHGRTCPLC